MLFKWPCQKGLIKDHGEMLASKAIIHSHMIVCLSIPLPSMNERYGLNMRVKLLWFSQGYHITHVYLLLTIDFAQGPLENS